MRVLSFRDLREIKGLPYSRVHVERLVREGKFPPPVRLSPARLAFVEAEVDQWLAERIAARDADQTAA